MSPDPIVRTTTLTVQADTSNGDVEIVQNPKPGEAGEFVCELEVSGTAGAKAKAFMGFLDHSKLKPDQGTLEDSIQNVLFPFQDKNNNPLTPTFNTQMAHGSVEVVFVVFMEGMSAAQPWEAVVIVDW